MMDLKILITGASGNLGGRILPVIHDLGNKCGILLRPNSEIKGKNSTLKNLSILRSSSEVEISNFIRIFDPDVIIHAACNYGLSGEGIIEISRTNINLGLSIINSLNFQDSSKTFVNINTALPSEVSAYAKSKHQFSFLCQEFAERSSGKFKFINLITQTIYGGNPFHSGFISRIINECLNATGDLKLTPGHQKRDFIHVDDVAGAIKTIILNIKNNKLEDQYDLGSGESRSIREVVTLIHSLSNSKVNLLFGALPYRENEPMDLFADISKLGILGWVPTMNFEEEIHNMILFRGENAKTLP
jgi:nucleoside-diphosphate-sugar epimerase